MEETILKKNIELDLKQREVISFLVSKQFIKTSGGELHIKGLCHIYEFKFYNNDLFRFRSYSNDNNLLYYANNKFSEGIIFKLCDLDSFKILYNNILNLKINE